MKFALPADSWRRANCACRGRVLRKFDGQRCIIKRFAAGCDGRFSAVAMACRTVDLYYLLNEVGLKTASTADEVRSL